MLVPARIMARGTRAVAMRMGEVRRVPGLSWRLNQLNLLIDETCSIHVNRGNLCPDFWHDKLASTV